MTAEGMVEVPTDFMSEWSWVAACMRIAEALVPVPIDDWVWRRTVWGKRIIARKVPKDTKMGMIHLPEQSQVEHKAGWPVLVGPEICIPDPGRFPNVCPYDSPLELVGRPIYWSPFAGADIFPPEARRGDSDYCIITVGDILGVELEHTLPEVTSE